MNSYIAPLPTSYPGTAQLEVPLLGARKVNISVRYISDAVATNGKARVKIVRLAANVSGGAIVYTSMGQESELQENAGVLTLDNYLEYETQTASTGASTATLPLWDSREVAGVDGFALYAYEAGDAAHPGNLVVSYTMGV
ncbi:MAG: hypothetical protein WC551_12755 [Patescibacteria group bacterium]